MSGLNYMHVKCPSAQHDKGYSALKYSENYACGFSTILSKKKHNVSTKLKV